MSAATGFARAVFHDLLSAAPQPLPPMAWPRALRWLPHTLVLLAAGALCATGADATARGLAILHAATLVLGLHRPVPAWWLSVAIAVGLTISHPPSPENELWAWVVLSGSVFLLVLRNRHGSAVAAALISALAAFGLHLAGIGTSWPVQYTGVLLAVAVLLGAVLRGRRVDREKLAEQQAATARERAHRTLLEERARIARELHDVVAHHMSLAAIQADAAPHRVQDPPEELVDAFRAIRGSALEALTELRHVLGVLRIESAAPADPSPQPTLDRIDDLFADVRAAGTPVTARVTGRSGPLPPSLELSAFRIVQEALSNVLRHAPGAKAEVEIVHTDAAPRLRILNGPPGRGAVPPAGEAGGGHGVLGMRERAAILGGELTAGPTPDGGYEVAALLPAAAVRSTVG
ncbi:histidine kinase [Kitasatospora sp. NPDC094015]|uniref:sensor histidine kinase n=1 Tax=Kitasatospora sp. NPDC094015 TaxID=3155205 RepID=UPI0033205049